MAEGAAQTQETAAAQRGAPTEGGAHPQTEQARQGELTYSNITCLLE